MEKEIKKEDYLLKRDKENFISQIKSTSKEEIFKVEEQPKLTLIERLKKIFR